MPLKKKEKVLIIVCLYYLQSINHHHSYDRVWLSGCGADEHLTSSCLIARRPPGQITAELLQIEDSHWSQTHNC